MSGARGPQQSRGRKHPKVLVDVTAIRQCVSWLTAKKVRNLFSHTDWETEDLAFLIFSNNGFQVLEEGTAELWELNMCLKRTEEGFTTANPF